MAEKKNLPATQDTGAIAPVELTPEVVKKYICPAANDQEIFMFIQLCRHQGLNPFLREVYLIKYGSDPAQMVTGKDTFTKRATTIPTFKGFKAGVVIAKKGAVSATGLEYREGAIVLSGEELVGGWAEVYRTDRDAPVRNECSIAEFKKFKSDGKPMAQWGKMEATMIRKVALVQSLREAFPDAYEGMYDPAEMSVDDSVIPTYEVGKELSVTPKADSVKPAKKERAKEKDPAPVVDVEPETAPETASFEPPTQEHLGPEEGTPKAILQRLLLQVADGDAEKAGLILEELTWNEKRRASIITLSTLHKTDDSVVELAIKRLCEKFNVDADGAKQGEIPFSS